MAKPQQVLYLDPPSELVFKGPFTECVTSNLRLTNPTSRAVFFKVKTTAPRYYCVRPNSGVIKPAETAVINVMLQPVDQPAALENERARHKFMIQTAYTTDESVPVETFWKNVDQSQVMDSKLRVVFVKLNEPDGSDDSSAVKKSAPSAAQSVYSAARSDDHDQELQKEIELRKLYQDEKSKLERENAALLDRLDKLARGSVAGGKMDTMGSSLLGEGFPTLHVILIAFLALFLGIIIGKIF
ncbi:MSP (Major sperm protein) domain-containing protein [Ditylenchus destructor]|nr:MSP (Major sperm protein) domain-containing protein [Ditylenchus destructor]